MSELIDNRAHRISVLKEIIQHLHAGAAPELVKEQLRKIVGETDATEIMAMERQAHCYLFVRFLAYLVT